MRSAGDIPTVPHSSPAEPRLVPWHDQIDRPGPARDLTFRTSDGLELRGRWQESPDADATVVLVHGFSATRDDKAVCAFARGMIEEGLNALTYDARGHGASEGQCGVGTTEHLDVAAAVDHASEAGLPIVLVGVSMGAVAVLNYLASQVVSDTNIAGAVLVSAPSRWRMKVSPVGMLTAALTRTPPGRFIAARSLRVRVAPRWRVGEIPESVVQRIAFPLAIVHGTGDRLLAVLHGRRLHASAGGPSRLEVVKGMGHGIDDRCQSAALESIKWILGPGAQPHHQASPTTPGPVCATITGPKVPTNDVTGSTSALTLPRRVSASS